MAIYTAESNRNARFDSYSIQTQTADSQIPILYADVPLRNYSFTHSLTHSLPISAAALVFCLCLIYILQVCH